MNSSEIQKRFGENLRFIRKQKKLTQFQLAELANVSEDTIKSIEQGRTWFSEKVLSQITEALNVDVVSLFIPIGESLISRKENSSQLKMAIRENVRNYTDEILKEYS